MPTGDITPPECPPSRCHSQTSANVSVRPVVTARVAETTCRSQSTSSPTVTADRKLQQQPIIHLPKLGEKSCKAFPLQVALGNPELALPLRVFVCGHPRLRVWKWIPLQCRPPLRTLVSAWQLTLQGRERALHRHALSQLVHAVAQIRRQNSTPRPNRVSVT